MNDEVQIPPERLDAIISRYKDVTDHLAKAPDPETTIALAKEMSDLEPVVQSIAAFRGALNELDGLTNLLSDANTDPDMRELAQDELSETQDKAVRFLRELKLMLLPKDAADEKSVILEVRAGTGGDEAALFAGHLFRMYVRYADLNGWKTEIMSESEGTVGGYKEIVAQIRGKGVYARLKFESGVHRVQRVPDTETSGRIHTSAATVAVLPEAEEVDVAIDEADLRIDTMRAGGAGGQHVNKTESAVRITHVPTGVVVVVQDERSQHKNKARAMALLRAKLYDRERTRLAGERAAERKAQVGSGDRSERIRTYNFPQGRVSDHRINLTLYTLEKVMLGELDDLINALVTEHQAALLASDT